jgi:hypothetical protein
LRRAESVDFKELLAKCQKENETKSVNRSNNVRYTRSSSYGPEKEFHAATPYSSFGTAMLVLYWFSSMFIMEEE